MKAALGFVGGAGLRLVGAAGFAAIALVGVLAVEHGSDPPAITAAVPVATSVHGRLELETTFPVARWAVQVQGQVVAGTSRDTRHWQAQVSGDPATIFVQADGEDPTNSAPVALRWRLAGRTGTLWGEGSVAGSLGGAER